MLPHQGGAPGTWGNLGLWPDDASTDPTTEYATAYATACRALAMAVGLAQAGRAAQPAIAVLCRPALPLDGHPALAGLFDAIVCVDAAYHLAPRAAPLAATWTRLRPGGRLAFCDLTVRPGAAPLLRPAARLCGLPADDLQPLATQVQRLQVLGFADVQARAPDSQVLGGFACFVRRQAAAHGLRPWQDGWRTAATTAALIPPCRAAGLGYALLSATRPAASGGGWSPGGGG